MKTDYLQIPEEQLVEKAPSAINDMGLFARQFIPWGKIFLEYKGRIVSGRDLREAEEKARRKGKSYLFELSADRYIEATKKEILPVLQTTLATRHAILYGRMTKFISLRGKTCGLMTK